MDDEPETDHSASMFSPDRSAEIVQRIHDLIVEDEVASLDSEHMVKCRVTGTEFVTYVGPFPDGFQAVTYAEVRLAELAVGAQPECYVIPLTSPEVGKTPSSA